MGSKKNIRSYSKDRRGITTVHLILLTLILSGIVASATLMTGIVARSSRSKGEATILQIEANNLFTFVDIVMEEESKAICEEIRAERKKKSELENAKIEDPALDVLVKDFWKKAKRILPLLENYLNSSDKIRQYTGMTVIGHSMEYEYYDHRNGMERFVSMAQGRLPSDGEIDALGSIRSSSDISIRVLVVAKNEEGRRTRYAKYYYFDLDRSLEMTDEAIVPKVIGGAVFYGE